MEVCRQQAIESSERILTLPTVRQTRLQEKRRDKVKCGVCERRCLIPEQGLGFCKTRMNIHGSLYTLVYGDISSISSNPIEKKPFYHFWPGTSALTIGTWGCNFTCPWCQNFHISKSSPDPVKANYVPPESLVKTALSERCQGTSVSFNEPTLLLEYCLDLFPLARRAGLYNTYVSNGYMTKDTLRMLKEAGLDAIKFDVKGDKQSVRRFCTADVDHVWRNIRDARSLDLHVEVVVLMIPGVNSSEECLEELARRHVKEAGSLTPLHFTRFYPAYMMTKTPTTPVETLENAYRIAANAGVKYVYLGNVSGHKFENTYCHLCGQLVLERWGFSVVNRCLTQDGRCVSCGSPLPIVCSQGS